MKSKIQKTLFAIGLSTSLALPIAPIALSLTSCSNVNQDVAVSQQDSSPIVNINHSDSTDNCQTTLIPSDKLFNTDYDLEMLKNDFNDYLKKYYSHDATMTVTSIQLNQDDHTRPCIDIKMNYYKKTYDKDSLSEHDTIMIENKANIEIKHVWVKPITYVEPTITDMSYDELDSQEPNKQVCLGLSIPNATSSSVFISHDKKQSFQLQINYDTVEMTHHPQSGIYDHETDLETKENLSVTYWYEWVPEFSSNKPFEYCNFVKLSSPNIQKNFSYILEAQPDPTTTPSN